MVHNLVLLSKQPLSSSSEADTSELTSWGHHYRGISLSLSLSHTHTHTHTHQTVDGLREQSGEALLLCSSISPGQISLSLIWCEIQLTRELPSNIGRTADHMTGQPDL